LEDAIDLVYEDGLVVRCRRIGGSRLKPKGKIGMFLIVFLLAITLAVPLVETLSAQSPKYSREIIIKPSAVILSYTDTTGNEVILSIESLPVSDIKPLAYVWGDWSEPYATYLIWGSLKSSGTYNGRPYRVYTEQNYGFWLNRMKVKFLFTDIPAGYDKYFVTLYYIDEYYDETCVVTWDSNPVDTLDGSWHCKKWWPCKDFEVDHAYQEFVIFQDYSSYHSEWDWWSSDIVVCVPTVYAFEY
jgi:hypothetical protein